MVVSHAALRRAGKTMSRREVPEQRGSLTSGLLWYPHWEQPVGELGLSSFPEPHCPPL